MAAIISASTETVVNNRRLLPVVRLWATFWMVLCLLVIPIAGHATPGETPPDPKEDDRQSKAPAAETITMARATWDTGWFQVEIFVALLEALGYAVAPPQTMENQAFYEAAVRGEMDLWVNGWFPSHNAFLSQNADSLKVVPVGY